MDYRIIDVRDFEKPINLAVPFHFYKKMWSFHGEPLDPLLPSNLII